VEGRHDFLREKKEKNDANYSLEVRRVYVSHRKGGKEDQNKSKT